MSIYDLTKINLNEENRTISPENITGEKGKAAMSSSDLGRSRKGHGSIKLPKGSTVTIADIHSSGEIRHLWMTIADATPDGSFVLRDVVLRMYWDGAEKPAVEVPIGDFFCNGFGERCNINSALITVNPTGGFNSYFPMPFKKSAKITITNEHPGDIDGFFYGIDYVIKKISNDVAYFHSAWNRQEYTQKQNDFVVLPTIEGPGHFVGVYFEVCALQRYWWGEGEFKFYIDGDTNYPTVTSTGTEDYFGGAWAFHNKDKNGQTYAQTYQRPFMGYPFMSKIDHTRENFNNGELMPLHAFGNDALPMHGLYRFHILDPIRFKNNLRVTVQQIGNDDLHLFERSDDVTAVTYWYSSKQQNNLPALASREKRIPR
ncbi:hypothetical protein DS832_02540 [Bombilactobacillus bombi]|uniref:DUF2961 domain-containing protein n=1 Tax=Bombilactobacillus bombi TaxID=1303590 RepID=A0A417ZC34_9LACO|nr:glycoside hydrolase family 172 protein [Bombilactobacillus bombi]RHW48210.1 hypothetical protein DS832_02540 [Bombilactobacillus bombi]